MLSTIVLWFALVTYLSGALISFNFFEKPLRLKENHRNELSLPTVFCSVVVRASNSNISGCRFADYIEHIGELMHGRRQRTLITQ